ncbi:hypothetical protein [Geodermatophilus nigrescens]|uniref:Lipoprotein antigen n=1 Tax=Geodermatophilus nigrescens TaxID=1070870 RepID=A0A1M5N8W6_9ACTN|nr:hypothetical protein [Geodermatophilus nigrescens]SHG85629.1 hypothetical protein SAMN05444351_3443 [Geodermatophilus nigrescens]
MRPLLGLTAAALVLLGAAGCTASGDDADGGSPGTPAAPTAPELAGPAEAEVLAALPAGAATGTAVLSYAGLGELREPFTGQCSHDGGSTRIEGSADTARITLVVGPDGARLDLDDSGVTSSTELSTGRYEVSGNHLSLAADLALDGMRAGSADLEIDCGG